MFAQLNLRLTGPLDQLRIVWQAGENVLEAVPFEADAEGTRYNILLALQEMVTNILRHGYECDESRPIELEFTVDDEAFAVTLRDQGPPFDPLDHDVPAAVDDAMPREVGGYGIHIARMVMDEVSYQRDGDHNVLRLKKIARASSEVV